MALRNLQISALAACAGVGLCAFTLHAQDANEPALATYAGGAITRADYEKTAATKIPELRLQLAKEESAKRALLEDMVDFELLLLEAQRRGYADHPAVVHAVRDESVKQLIEGPLAVALDSLPEADVKAAYQARIAEFTQPELRRARHVVLATEEEAKALIAEARKAGPKAGELIASVAREKSLDLATKRQSGELGAFSESGEHVGGKITVDPALVKAVFALRKEGDVAPKPIALKEGFSVVVMLNRAPASKTPDELAFGAVRDSLAEERTAAATEALLVELKKARPTETFPERIEWVTLDPPAPADIPQGFSAAPRDPTAPPVMQEPDGI